MIIQQGRHVTALQGLAFLLLLDLRVVGLGTSKAFSQMWRKKGAEEERASEKKERGRGWLGATHDQAMENQKGPAVPPPLTLKDRGRQ